MSSSDLAISVRGLGKSYSIRHNATDAPTTLAESIMRRVRHPFARGSSQRETFWALKDVNFEVKKGEVVGVIGRNGAGKSTLLKILSRITEPTTGEIDLYGRVGSLLEVGTGFHQELTGRENIYLNGSILGMRRKEIDQQFDAIVDFAGVEQFLDTPVKRYSSGMYVRLAFAVAAHLRSEILIVDEVLSVGDAEFQRKCIGKMDEVAHRMGRTVLFVSHNMGLVTQLCSKGVCLTRGKVTAIGEMDEVVRTYVEREIRQPQSNESLSDRPADLDVAFAGAGVIDDAGHACVEVDVRRSFGIRVQYEVRRPVRNIELSVRLCAADGRAVFVSHESDCSPQRVRTREPGAFVADIPIPQMFLMPGDYTVDLLAHEPNVRMVDHIESAFAFTVLETGSKAAIYNRHQYMGVVLIDLPWSVTPSRAPAAHGALGDSVVPVTIPNSAVSGHGDD